jgi:hypothetical protein
VQEKTCGPQPQAYLLALQDIQKALIKNPTWTGKQLKEKIPSLERIGSRTIQRASKEKP